MPLALGRRLMAGQRTLDPPVVVRVHAPQPFFTPISRPFGYDGPVAEPYPGVLLLSRNQAVRAYLELLLEGMGLSLMHFDSAREGLFWLRDYTPKLILLDQELDLDPFSVAARITHVRRLKEVPVAVLIAPDERLKTTAEVVRVRVIEKPLTREKLLPLVH